MLFASKWSGQMVAGELLRDFCVSEIPYIEDLKSLHRQLLQNLAVPDKIFSQLLFI